MSTERHIRLPVFLTILIVTALLSLLVGRLTIPASELFLFIMTWLSYGDMPNENYQLINSVIFEARAPRVIAAILVGAGLSISGASYQAVFRNPLVSPGLLGVLSGCAFGAALGLIYELPSLLLVGLSSLTGLVAVTVGVGISLIFKNSSILFLVFGGIISNAIFSSLLSITKYMADPINKLPDIVYWLLGSLGAVTQQTLLIIGPLLFLAIMFLCAAGRAIDAVSLSDDEALCLGVPVKKIRYGVIAIATFICALTVSIAGIVGWVGLMVPHLARLLVGPENTRLLPVSACLGGVFLLISDGIARSISAGEIPLGIITELLGAVAFVLLLRRVRRGWL